ncbi:MULTISPECIES: hypothetical protein [unclassified Nocardioides]|uniref:hypothetical protein n=1 Tax=unclassified Nocardioides TaxID=2615069 RepID=UPI001122DB68|nr:MULTISPECIES: hypothetical protein [unclassified Nocardioides]
MTAPRPAASPAASPAPSVRSTSAGLVDLRAFVILMFSLFAGFLAALPAGLAASEHSSKSPLTVGLLAGGAAFIAVGLSTAATLNSLIDTP